MYVLDVVSNGLYLYVLICFFLGDVHIVCVVYIDRFFNV